jgi:hypothetical protein
VGSRRAFYTARTALWITCGWIVAALLVHWIVRRVPTHPARELAAAATGAAMGVGSAWFELSLIPRYVRSMTVGAFLLFRTAFYVTLCAFAIYTVTFSLLGSPSMGGCLGTTGPNSIGISCWAVVSCWRWRSSRW